MLTRPPGTVTFPRKVLAVYPASMGRSERDTFLSKTRLGILTTLNAGGEPISVPVWFEWDGRQARCFSYNRAAKVRRLKRDQRAWLLVTNAVGEPEFWGRDRWHHHHPARGSARTGLAPRGALLGPRRSGTCCRRQALAGRPGRAREVGACANPHPGVQRLEVTLVRQPAGPALQVAVS